MLGLYRTWLFRQSSRKYYSSFLICVSRLLSTDAFSLSSDSSLKFRII